MAQRTETRQRRAATRRPTRRATPRGTDASQQGARKQGAPVSGVAAKTTAGARTASSSPSAAADATATKATPASDQARQAGRAPTQRGDGPSWRPRRKYLAFVFALVALAAIYLLGCAHFSRHFTPGTTVAGVDASMLSAQDLAARLEERAQTLTDHVSGEGLDFNIAAAEAGLSCDGQSCAESALTQVNPASWPLDLFVATELEPMEGITVDAAQLRKAVAKVVDTYNANFSAYDAEATIVFDEQRKKFVTTNELANMMLDTDAVASSISKDLQALRSSTVIDASALMKPTLDDEDRRLMQEAERANRMLELSIPLTLNGSEIMKIGGDLIAGWLTVTQGQEGPQVSASPEAITQWSYANLNAVVNGETETRVWEVDSPAAGQALATHIDALDASPLEAPTVTVEERPAESEGARERGRHIDVNISTQYARLYDSDGTVLWRSYIVTGDPRLDRDTPIGDYQIINMEENVTLTGGDDDGDGEPDYTSYVYYWMCFDGVSYGLHDATWRSPEEFGGDTYAIDGSHGCVNLPFDAAAQLYGLIHLGDPVHIHY